MEEPSVSPRIIRWTSAVLRLRNSAAWPAELPPPTMATGPPWQAWASIWVAA